MAKESIRKLLQLGLSCTDLEALCCSVVRGSAAIHRISQMATPIYAVGEAARARQQLAVRGISREFPATLTSVKEGLVRRSQVW